MTQSLPLIIWTIIHIKARYCVYWLKWMCRAKLKRLHWKMKNAWMSPSYRLWWKWTGDRVLWSKAVVDPHYWQKRNKTNRLLEILLMYYYFRFLYFNYVFYIYTVKAYVIPDWMIITCIILCIYVLHQSGEVMHETWHHVPACGSFKQHFLEKILILLTSTLCPSPHCSHWRLFLINVRSSSFPNHNQML